MEWCTFLSWAFEIAFSSLIKVFQIILMYLIAICIFYSVSLLHFVVRVEAICDPSL